MDAYQYNLIESFIKILILFFLVFYMLGKGIFKKSILSGLERFFVQLSLSTTLLITIGYMLVVTKLYDTLVLLLFLFTIIGLIVWIKNRGKKGGFFTRINYNLLRILEIDLKSYFIKNFNARKDSRNKGETDFNGIWYVLLMLLLVVTGFVRLFPAYQIASPFSINEYKILHHVKYLELKNLFPNGEIFPKGLHLLIDSFFQFSRINPAITVHIFSGLAAILLTVSIYHIIVKSVQNNVAAILGASVFGVFTGLLPMNLNQQVEANTIVISVVLVFLSITFFLDYLLNKKKIYLYTSLVGFVGAILISFFTLGVFFLSILPLSLGYLITNRKTVFKGNYQWVITLIPAGWFVAIYFFCKAVMSKIIFSETIRSILLDETFDHFNRVDMIFSETHFFYICIAFSGLLILISFIAKNPNHKLTLFFYGVFTLIVSFVWQGNLFGIANVFIRSQIGFILSVSVSICAGFVVYFFLFYLIGERGLIKNASPSGRMVYGLIIFLIFTEGMILSRTSKIAKFDHQTEPEGFARSVYEIQNKFDAYQWTVVSHYGTRVQVINFGRYMDYLYFLTHYDAKTFNQNDEKKIPTEYVFIFVEKDTLISRVDTELLPNIPNLTRMLQNWCVEYQQNHQNLKVFYEDQEVIIYQIKNSANNQSRKIAV